MKFLKIARAAESAEDAAVVVRLTAVVGRSQAELSFYPSNPEPSVPQGVQRRFWMPEELAAEDGGE